MLFSKEIGLSGPQPFWAKLVSFILLLAWLLFDSGIARAAVFAWEPEGKSPVENTDVSCYDTNDFHGDHHVISLPESSEPRVDRENREDEPDNDWKICCNPASASRIYIAGDPSFCYTVLVNGLKSRKLYILYHSWKSFLS